MTPPGRHLRAIPDPGHDADREPFEPTGPDLTDLLGPRVPVPADSFLDLVDAAGTVAPLHGGISGMSPGDLLRMLGGPPAAADPPTPLVPAPGEHDRAALLDRLSVAAWDVVRTRAAEHDPVLLDTLVQVCTRLSAQPGS